MVYDVIALEEDEDVYEEKAIDGGSGIPKAIMPSVTQKIKLMMLIR